MTDFRFHDPWWLLLVIPLAGWAVWSARRREGAAILYSEVSLLAQLPRTAAQRWRRLAPWLRSGGLGLLVLALARPQCGEEAFRVPTPGIAILMCLDRSGSMQEPFGTVDGGGGSRLEAARKAFRDFVAGKGALPGRANDRIGLVAFSGFVENVCPLTLDHQALLGLLETVRVTPPPSDPAEAADPRWAEERLTAIGDAVTAAMERLQGAEAKSRVIVLLSDGQQTAGAVLPSEAAATAKALGIKVYTISLREEPGALAELSEITGGRSFQAADAGALEQVYAEIDQLETTTSEGRLYTQYRELYLWLMFPAMGLILLEIVLRSTRLRGLP